MNKKATAPDTKELSIVKQQVTRAVSAANDLSIKSEEDMKVANDILAKIKKVGKLIKERREEITRPLNEALKSARELFAPLEDSYAAAQSIVKQKMVTYIEVAERERAKQEAKIIEKVEEGKLSEEKAVQRLEQLPTVKTAFDSKAGSMHTSTVKKFRVVDLSQVPLEYHLPDEVKIRKAMFEGVKLPGVEYWDEKQITGRPGM